MSLSVVELCILSHKHFGENILMMSTFSFFFHRIFDRELCSKVLKEALFFFLFFLILAWNQVQKMCVGTKNVCGNKKCSWEQKMFMRTKNVRWNKKCPWEQKNGPIDNNHHRCCKALTFGPPPTPG